MRAYRRKQFYYVKNSNIASFFYDKPLFGNTTAPGGPEGSTTPNQRGCCSWTHLVTFSPTTGDGGEVNAERKARYDALIIFHMKLKVKCDAWSRLNGESRSCPFVFSFPELLVKQSRFRGLLKPHDKQTLCPSLIFNTVGFVKANLQFKVVPVSLFRNRCRGRRVQWLTARCANETGRTN